MFKIWFVDIFKYKYIATKYIKIFYLWKSKVHLSAHSLVCYYHQNKISQLDFLMIAPYCGQLIHPFRDVSNWHIALLRHVITKNTNMNFKWSLWKNEISENKTNVNIKKWDTLNSNQVKSLGCLNDYPYTHISVILFPLSHGRSIMQRNITECQNTNFKACLLITAKGKVTGQVPYWY
jgi:hypothetical protein